MRLAILNKGYSVRYSQARFGYFSMWTSFRSNSNSNGDYCSMTSFRGELNGKYTKFLVLFSLQYAQTVDLVTVPEKSMHNHS